MDYPGLNDLIKRALLEDIGHQDITTAHLISPKLQATGIFYAKSDGILAGIEVSQAVFKFLDPAIVFEKVKIDGERIAPGDEIAIVKGAAATLLTGRGLPLIFCSICQGSPRKQGEWFN